MYTLISVFFCLRWFFGDFDDVWVRCLITLYLGYFRLFRDFHRCFRLFRGCFSPKKNNKKNGDPLRITQNIINIDKTNFRLRFLSPPQAETKGL